MVERTAELTIEEFVRRYEQAPFEIIDGEHIVMSPTVFGHSSTTKRIYDALLRSSQATGTVEVFFETAFILTEKTDWVKGSRTPDVMVIDKDRLAAYERQMDDADSKPLMLVPDLVVEVISKNDSYSNVNRKVEAYLHDGVKIIWVVDPQRERVAVYADGSDRPVMKGAGDVLSGGALLPGFELGVGEIFGAK